MANLKLNHVNKIFGSVQTIFDVNLEIQDGEFVVFVGPSGCGKSTLLRLIAGLESISSGQIEIGDRVVNDLEPSKRGIAMVFQSYALYPHMTVAENMSIGLKVNGVPKEEAEHKARLAAKSLQLEHLMDRKPAQLSGGQRQRVAIGRAIVRNPDVFLFDEPLSNLDAELRVKMRLEIANLHEELGSTMIYVTHDQVEAMTMADKIVVLKDGHVEQVGSPMDLYHNPINQFVAGFIGSPKMNFISLQLEEQRGKDVTFMTSNNTVVHLILADAKPLEKGPFTLGIRPEHTRLGNEGDIILQVTISAIELLGGTCYVHANYGADTNEIVVETSPESEVKRHEKREISFSMERCYLFDKDGNTLLLAK